MDTLDNQTIKMHKPQERIFSKQNAYNLSTEWRQHFQQDPNSLSANPQILYKTEINQKQSFFFSIFIIYRDGSHPV